MRCTQMLLLPIAFLVLSSDVIMEASAGIGIDPISYRMGCHVELNNATNIINGVTARLFSDKSYEE
ncbi:hypothetical protein TRIUR3_28183 [Triticum urartu]|uniref:Uncharacterized protein n=1 Tax=Triticum urartu TaxID=4572 RepID=M7Z2P7_TRIUA|nr:hypothetical protein TRIUR3_28183 [Triticum urartu]